MLRNSSMLVAKPVSNPSGTGNTLCGLAQETKRSCRSIIHHRTLRLIWLRFDQSLLFDPSLSQLPELMHQDKLGRILLKTRRN